MKFGAHADSFTTGEVAAMCGVHGAYVQRVFEKIGLRVRKIPGSKHRRVDRLDLIEWLANRPDWHWVLVAMCGPLPDGWGDPGGCVSFVDRDGVG